MTQWITDHPWLTTIVVGYLVMLGIIAWRYLKPPPGPPPSGMAESSYALTGLDSAYGAGGT